jgi:hypothetical protein
VSDEVALTDKIPESLRAKRRFRTTLVVVGVGGDHVVTQLIKI